MATKGKPERRGAIAAKSLPAKQRDALLAALQARFERHPERHRGLKWSHVQARLEAHPEKILPLHEMERTGGEPDVVGHDPATGAVVFFDCAIESPAARASLCYDREGLESRKEHRPANSAIDVAAAMGVELLDENQYQALQTLGSFDQKSSSWLKTAPEMRQLGGAIFGDRRFGRVFIYHNGAQSYYSGRGFRASLQV